MYKVLLLGLALAVATGCKRDKNDPTKKDSPPPTTPPTGGGGGGGGGVGGGSGGAPQAVRGAVQRTVNLNELKNIQLFIETASAASGRMPTPQEVAAALQKEAPKTFALVQDGS